MTAPAHAIVSLPAQLRILAVAANTYADPVTTENLNDEVARITRLDRAVVEPLFAALLGALDNLTRFGDPGFGWYGTDRWVFRDRDLEAARLDGEVRDAVTAITHAADQAAGPDCWGCGDRVTGCSRCADCDGTR